MQLHLIVYINGLCTKNFTPSWDNEVLMSQQRKCNYEPGQLDYDTGLPIKEAK